MAKALSALLRKAKERGFIEGFDVCRREEIITHLLLVDDTILFSSTRRSELAVFKKIFRCFELSSGLKINLAKSALVGVGCSEEVVQSLASKLPMSYLGLPVRAMPRSKTAWDAIMENFQRKLSVWKRNSLSLSLLGKG